MRKYRINKMPRKLKKAMKDMWIETSNALPESQPVIGEDGILRVKVNILEQVRWRGRMTKWKRKAISNTRQEIRDWYKYMINCMNINKFMEDNNIK